MPNNLAPSFGNFNVDELVSRIDKKIEELEKEEKAEKEREEKGKREGKKSPPSH